MGVSIGFQENMQHLSLMLKSSCQGADSPPDFSSSEDKHSRRRVKKSKKTSSKKKKSPLIKSDLDYKKFNDRMYPTDFQKIIPTHFNQELIPATLINSSRLQNQVHERLYAKSKSPMSSNRASSPVKSSPMRYSEKRILQAHKEMECSFKPQISQRSSEIVDQMRMRTLQQSQPSDSHNQMAGNPRIEEMFNEHVIGFQLGSQQLQFDDHPLYQSRDNKLVGNKQSSAGKKNQSPPPFRYNNLP